MSILQKTHNEWCVNMRHRQMQLPGRICTDCLVCSSASTGKIVLACSLVLTVGTLYASPQTTAFDGRAKGRETVGQRLAADLTWTQTERDLRFQHMGQIFPVHKVRRSGRVRVLPSGTRLPLGNEFITGYMQKEHLAGVIVLQDGAIRAERYALGLSPSGRWTTFSVTKAVTDTLAGAAFQSGALRTLDGNVAEYLPEMRGSAYDGVSIRQLMTMTSGVHWNESYTSPTADNVLLYSTPVAAGLDPVVEYMRRLPRQFQPGTRWQYNTGETDLLGVLLRRATGRTLAEQLSRTIWQNAGMQRDATWIATASGPAGEEFGGSGLSATLRDLGRFGLWVLEGGHDAVAANWFEEATRQQVQAGRASYGYGWWPQHDGTYAALGIFGQSIFIDPKRHLVIVTVGNWPDATGPAHTAARTAFWQQVQAAADAP